MLKTRVESLERDVQLLVNEALSPEAQAKLFASAAKTIIQEVDDANDRAAGRDLEFTTFVNGREDDTLSSVKVGSTVVATWDVGTSVLMDIMEMLAANAPVLTGEFRKTLLMLADGMPADPANPPQASEYVFVSPQPFARKLERWGAWKSSSGTMEGVAAVAQRRFGSFARIRFGYRSLQGGAIGAWAATTTIGRRGRTRQDWLTRQPAIIITLR